MEAFVAVGAWKNTFDLEANLTLPELTHIVDMSRFKRHGELDFLAKVVTGEGLSSYQSMTDIDDSDAAGSSGSSDMDLDSEFTITHLPIGLGYETQ